MNKVYIQVFLGTFLAGSVARWLGDASFVLSALIGALAAGVIASFSLLTDLNKRLDQIERKAKE